jgi:hypothetical protein
MESRGLAANTINQQLAAVRRLADEAADSGLLSPELAAGISRSLTIRHTSLSCGLEVTILQRLQRMFRLVRRHNCRYIASLTMSALSRA